LPDAPWATAWKADFRSIPIGRRLLIRPDWEMGTPPPDPAWADRLPLWLRPGLGFGTGRHETTRLALETLENHLRPGMTVLDFGSGSGVLSIAAVALGASTVYAVEFDPQANENARDNLALNQVSEQVTLIEADQPAAAPGKADLVICNMLPHNALRHMSDLVHVFHDAQSTLIYSGYLADQEYEIEKVLSGAGLKKAMGAQLNEWAVWVGRRMT
jgi:ribosomal protein L11 methyltransferase